MNLNWKDNSDNEIKFDVYLKINDGEYYSLSEISDINLQPHYFPQNSTSGKIEWGSRAGWAKGNYTFKIKAVAALIESEFSNEITVTIDQ